MKFANYFFLESIRRSFANKQSRNTGFNALIDKAGEEGNHDEFFAHMKTIAHGYRQYINSLTRMIDELTRLDTFSTYVGAEKNRRYGIMKNLASLDRSRVRKVSDIFRYDNLDDRVLQQVHNGLIIIDQGLNVLENFDKNSYGKLDSFKRLEGYENPFHEDFFQPNSSIANCFKDSTKNAIGRILSWMSSVEKSLSLSRNDINKVSSLENLKVKLIELLTNSKKYITPRFNKVHDLIELTKVRIDNIIKTVKLQPHDQFAFKDAVTLSALINAIIVDVKEVGGMNREIEEDIAVNALQKAKIIADKIREHYKLPRADFWDRQ